MLILHLSVWIPYSILACLWIDIAVILVPSVVGLVSIPLFFAVKGNASQKYTLSALIAHIVLCAIAFVLINLLLDAISTMYGSWESIGHFFVLIFILAIGLLLPALDGLVSLVRWLMKGREF